LTDGFYQLAGKKASAFFSLPLSLEPIRAFGGPRCLCQQGALLLLKFSVLRTAPPPESSHARRNFAWMRLLVLWRAFLLTGYIFSGQIEKMRACGSRGSVDGADLPSALRYVEFSAGQKFAELPTDGITRR